MSFSTSSSSPSSVFSLTFIVVLTAPILLFITSTEAQSGLPSCAEKLIPCAEYLNETTTPSQSCCSGIKEAISKDLTCLCNLYNTPGLLQSFGVNVTQALQLPKRCRLHSMSLTVCSKVTAPSPSPTPTPTPTLTPPPAGIPGNDGSKMTWVGFSSLILLVAHALA